MQLMRIFCLQLVHKGRGALSADSRHAAQCFLPKWPQYQPTRGVMRQVALTDSLNCLRVPLVLLWLWQSAFISGNVKNMSYSHENYDYKDVNEDRQWRTSTLHMQWLTAKLNLNICNSTFINIYGTCADCILHIPSSFVCSWCCAAVNVAVSHARCIARSTFSLNTIHHTFSVVFVWNFNNTGANSSPQPVNVAAITTNLSICE